MAADARRFRYVPKASNSLDISEKEYAGTEEAAVAKRQMAEARFWLSVLGIHQSIYTDLNRALIERSGVSLAKFDAMAQLYRFPEGLTMGDLSKRLKVTNGNVSGLVNRLTIDGFVTKDVSEGDRRSFLVTLTATGTAAFELAMRVHKEKISEQMHDVRLADIQAATGTLRKIAAHLTMPESNP